MRTDIVLTLTGPDRVGIVEEVTGVLLDLGGNVGTGRMARLGGEFAILMLVSLPAVRLEALDAAFAPLADSGYKISMSPTEPAPGVTEAEATTYRIDVTGADHEGIIHEIARGLSAQGINIESAETGTIEAPVSGVPLFFMSALVSVPDDLEEAEWLASLDEAAGHAGVDIEVAAAETGR